MSAPMHAALAALPERIPVRRLDELWLFPPRRVANQESGLVVLSVFPEDEAGPDRRQVFTLRYLAARGPDAPRSDWLEEQGSAPVERISHIIAGVLHRLGEEDEPRREPVRGDAARWESLLAGFQDAELDRAYGE